MNYFLKYMEVMVFAYPISYMRILVYGFNLISNTFVKIYMAKAGLKFLYFRVYRNVKNKYVL